MGWVSYTIGEIPTQAEIKFFSISQELDSLKNVILEFISAVSPGYLTLIITCVILSIVVLFVYSVYIAVRDFQFDFDEENANNPQGGQ